jgi:acyl-CoA ligase (AMP-forming) (exosortase A-associated)
MDYLIHHMLRTSAQRRPDKEALVFGRQRLCYREVLRRTTNLAAGLRRLGVARADRVGVFLEPSLAQALSIFAVSQSGGVFVPIHHSLFPHQVKHIVNDCGMRGLVLTRDKLRQLRQLEEFAQDCPTLEFVVVVDGPGSTAGRLHTAAFEELVELCPDVPLQDISIGKDLAAILYTSGSTGRPKGVMLSHANVIAGASIVSEYVGIGPDDRTLAALPFSFDAGLNQIMTAFQQGATLVMTNFLFANDLVKQLLRERITGLAGVPTLWSLLANSGVFQKTEFPDLQYITNTGGPMPQTVLAILRDTLPDTQIFLMYGLTEAFRSTYLPPDEVDRRPTSIGKAIPDTEILVLSDKGEACKPGEVGELVHRGPTVSMGYWGQPELTEKVLRPYPFPVDGCRSDEKVCYSGDLVKMDNEGFLYFVGRRDNLIKSSGFRVSPTDVEEALYRTGRLEHAAVIGVPDEMLGQAIKAFVVPKSGESLNLDQLLDMCAAEMPTHMVPKTVEVLRELPKTTSGKVNYQALRGREVPAKA